MVMSSVADVEDLSKTFVSLGFFVLLNFVGQLTHLLFLFLSLAVLCKNPFRILKYCLPTYFIAFATTSGYVMLPLIEGMLITSKRPPPEIILRFFSVYSFLPSQRGESTEGLHRL